VLTNYLGGEAVAGGKLKATTLWNTPNIGATNSSSFKAFPGGYRWEDGLFGMRGEGGMWWSSTDFNPDDTNYRYAWLRYLYFYWTDVYRLHDQDKRDGFSVRCVRD
jgi:uncharacterized protein (TIGR02145 family)